MLAAVATLGARALLGAQKKQQRKPDLELVKIDSVRQEGGIVFEGDIKVTGEKAFVGLVMRFEFYDSGGELLTIQKIQIEEATILPAEKKHFQVQGRDVPRAVRYTVSASDLGGKELLLGRNGPYPLD